MYTFATCFFTMTGIESNGVKFLQLSICTQSTEQIMGCHELIYIINIQFKYRILYNAISKQNVSNFCIKLYLLYLKI